MQLAEFLVSSLFRAFIFLAILATFTLQMFFSFDIVQAADPKHVCN